MGTVTLGRIGSPRGLRGEVWVQSYTRPPASILDFPRWQLDGDQGSAEWSLAGGRVQAKGIVAAFHGCPDRDSAERLRGATVAVARSALPELAADEYYWHDLIGAAVETTDGVGLGRVDHWLETGANDVLVVRGERERLIPWDRGIHSEHDSGRVVRQVEVQQGRIVVDWDPAF